MPKTTNLIMITLASDTTFCLYNDPAPSLPDSWLHLIRSHANVLVALAQAASTFGPSSAVMRRFHQLRVMDFIVREIDLEYEALQRIQHGSLAQAPPAAWQYFSNYSQVNTKCQDGGSVVIMVDKGELKKVAEVNLYTLEGSSLLLSLKLPF